MKCIIRHKSVGERNARLVCSQPINKSFLTGRSSRCYKKIQVICRFANRRLKTPPHPSTGGAHQEPDLEPQGMKTNQKRIRLLPCPGHGIFLFLASLLLSASLVFLPPGAASAAGLYGVVSYPNGEPAGGIPLRIESLQGKGIFETRTGRQGNYGFPDIAPGSYLLRCQGQDQEIFVTPGHNRFDLYLE